MVENTKGERVSEGRRWLTLLVKDFIYIFIYLSIVIYLTYFNQFLPPQGWYASCHEMSKSRKLVKLKI